MTDPWDIFNYEVFMLFYTIHLSKFYNKPQNEHELALKNAVVESRLLHIRIIVDILLSRNKGFEDDLKLETLVDKENQTTLLTKLVLKLKTEYGNTDQVNSPCWILNKMLVHASNLRWPSYDYNGMFESIFPLIISIIEEIQNISNDNKLAEHLIFAKKHI